MYMQVANCFVVHVLVSVHFTVHVQPSNVFLCMGNVQPIAMCFYAWAMFSLAMCFYAWAMFHIIMRLCMNEGMDDNYC